ncbi:MAG: acylhydrolase [Ruminococcus sp.]|nr:acylhydrolase [Ruminococcus sp.]
MKFLKQCPVLILVVLSSILIPWRLIGETKNNNDTKVNSSAMNTVITTTVSTENSDNTESNITTSKENEENSENLNNGEESTEPTTNSEKPVQERNFSQADASYFDDALFIGNSRTVGLYLFGDMNSSTDFFADVGLTVYDSMESSIPVPPEGSSNNTLTGLLQSKQYGKIYIMFGINELTMGTSQSFADYYESVVNQIHELQPNAIIYIQSIINVSADRAAQGDGVNNEAINEKNEYLKQKANGQYSFYLNLNEVLTDENGCLNSDYTSDGVHLGGGSLPIWKDYLLSHAII